MIYRITTQEDWARAKAGDVFASEDLANEGFIHCSELHQVLRTALRYYKGARDLMLLEIDESLLGESLKREDTTGRGERFPHVDAPIPLDAVVGVFALTEGETGFQLPCVLKDKAK